MSICKAKAVPPTNLKSVRIPSCIIFLSKTSSFLLTVALCNISILQMVFQKQH